jgi:hypothetical protein
MQNFSLQTGVLGYLTAPDETTLQGSYLVAGSQNIIINRMRKFGNRAGYSRLGAGNTALTPVRNSYTWDSNTGLQLPVRFYDDELEHNYLLRELEQIELFASRNKIDLIVTTEKDGVKIAELPFGYLPVWALRVDLILEDQDKLEKLILG